LELEVAAWVEVTVYDVSLDIPDIKGDTLESLTVETWPVLKRAGHHHAMDIVEFLAEIPIVFQVVDLKEQIWRHTASQRDLIFLNVLTITAVADSNQSQQPTDVSFDRCIKKIAVQYLRFGMFVRCSC
jgi:hypothetical protein